VRAAQLTPRFALPGAGVLATMLPLEAARPYAHPLQRNELDAASGIVQSVPKARNSSTPHGIFQPQPSRAGNPFLSIQEALKSDHGAAHLRYANTIQQQRSDIGSAPIDRVHVRLAQPQALRAMASLPGLPVRDSKSDAQLTSLGFDSSADEDDDDYDYFQYCRRDHHAGHSSRKLISSDPQTSSSATSSMVRNWIHHFTPRELVSVDAACSIFSPGFNWPGNVKHSEMSVLGGKQQRASDHTLTSLVLRAEAEKSFALGSSHQHPNLSPNVAKPHTQAHNAMSLTPIQQQPSPRNAKQMPPPTVSADQSSKVMGSASTAKRPRGSRIIKQPESSGSAYLHAFSASFC
jgi:hypothetical protein